MKRVLEVSLSIHAKAWVTPATETETETVHLPFPLVLLSPFSHSTLKSKDSSLSTSAHVASVEQV